MGIRFTYDQGSSKYREDGIILSPPFFGVLDGTSAPYSPEAPMRFFGWMSQKVTGGELVSRTVERTFARMPPSHSIERAVMEANRRVAREQEKRGVPNDPGVLAGASFAIAKVTDDRIEVIQACDAFALWVMHDGSVNMTAIQNMVSETMLNNKVGELMEEIAVERGVRLEDIDDNVRDEIRAEMWNRFYSVLVETRRKYVNNPEVLDGYGLLNGQPELEMKWLYLALPRSEIKTLLLFTDGMVPWWGGLEGFSTDEIAQQVYVTYQQGGLCNLLARARHIEEANKATSYTDAAEATAIAIEF